MDINTGMPRVIEVVVAGIGLLLSAPLIAISAIAIAVTSPGPIIFRQERMGRKGQTFILYKMRTMHAVKRKIQVTASNDARITSIGRLLRRTKVDELPELWNVLKGDMSLVGPRPEVPRYVDFENNPIWRLVLEVRPGITDPMTVSLRNEEALLTQVNGNLEEFYLETLQPYKLRGYLEYLQQRTWQTDLRVLWQTLIVIISPSKTPVPISNTIPVYVNNRLNKVDPMDGS
jgi:lipopolysaccharide/colanic/teichoic acid biosynthesis glycosyltransferase